MLDTFGGKRDYILHLNHGLKADFVRPLSNI